MKNSNDTTGNRTRDLPTCSAVPQPTVPPRAPDDGGDDGNMMIHYILHYLSNSEGDEKKFALFWNVTPCSLLNMCLEIWRNAGFNLGLKTFWIKLRGLNIFLP